MMMLGMGTRLYAQTTTSSTNDTKLMITHMGYFDTGIFRWYVYFNEAEYYAKCYLGSNAVEAPDWTSNVTLIPHTFTSSDNSELEGKTYNLPTSFVFSDRPDNNYYTYTYTDPKGGTHELSYTLEPNGKSVTVYNVEVQEDNKAEFEKDKSSYSASNPLELTIPDMATITVNSEDKTYTEDITKLGVFQQYGFDEKVTISGTTTDYTWGYNAFSYLGTAIENLGVPVKLKLGANIKEIMPYTFRVSDYYADMSTWTDPDKFLKGCTNLYGFDFNGNTALWYIGKGAFKDATNLKLYPISGTDDHAVAVPTSLTQLQDSAFANSGIRSLIVTQPIQNLGNDVFENCDNMEYVSFKQLKVTADDGSITNNMLLSRDIDKFKETLKNNGTEVTTTEVKPEYQRLLQSIPNHVLIYAPNAFDKTYKYLDQSENGYNIITTGDEGKPHCYHFYVYDNTSVTGTNNATGSYDYWVPEEFQADVSSYNRAFPTGWVTTYLPFDWTLPDGCDAYQAADKLVDVNDKGQNVFTFTQVSGTAMKANTPYLLNNKSGNTVSIADAKGLTIPISVRPPYMTFLKDDHTTNALFWGTTEDIPNDSAAVNYQAYNIRPDQKWGKVVTSVPTGYIGHFRAFVSDTRTTTSSSAKPNVVLMLIGKNGETTSISTVDTDAVIGGQAAIYALDGSYMGTDFTRLPNGIYIKNGKKFTVKNR